MKTKTALIFFISLVGLWLASSCTPWIMRAPDLNKTEKSPTLVASAIVWSQPEGCDPHGHCSKKTSDILSVVSKIVDNSTLDQFGEHMLEKLTPFLEKQGFTLKWEPARAQKLNDLEIFHVDNDLAALTGYWHDPRASEHKFFHTVITSTSDNKAIAETLKGDDPKELYLCIYLAIGEEGVFFEEPILDLNIMILDHEGREVFSARSIGQGDSSFWVVDQSPENLNVALYDALQQLKDTKVEPLD